MKPLDCCEKCGKPFGVFGAFQARMTHRNVTTIESICIQCKVEMDKIMTYCKTTDKGGKL